MFCPQGPVVKGVGSDCSGLQGCIWVCQECSKTRSWWWVLRWAPGEAHEGLGATLGHGAGLGGQGRGAEHLWDAPSPPGSAQGTGIFGEEPSPWRGGGRCPGTRAGRQPQDCSCHGPPSLPRQIRGPPNPPTGCASPFQPIPHSAAARGGFSGQETNRGSLASPQILLWLPTASPVTSRL